LGLSLLVAACLSLLLPTALAASDEPGLSHTLFDNLPARIFYFDDTPVSPAVLYDYSEGGVLFECCEMGGRDASVWASIASREKLQRWRKRLQSIL